jgi:MoxR-like ATPase
LPAREAPSPEANRVDWVFAFGSLHRELELCAQPERHATRTAAATARRTSTHPAYDRTHTIRRLRDTVRLMAQPKPSEVGTEQSQSAAAATRLQDNIEQVVLGKHEEIALVLAALLSGGHVLLDDVPGTAKTILARAIAQSVDGAAFARIQCTPDLQPTDVTGLSIYNPRDREFEFRPGPIFANIVLVDEINRAMPKTQSALLEAMAERQVTIDLATRPLPLPFLVIATENPIEQEGTFPLPEAQLDRFAIRTALGYPDEKDELAIVDAQRHGHPITRLEAVVSVGDVEGLQGAVEDVYIDPLLARWVVDVVRATRSVEGIAVGASVRGSITLERTARAWALLHGRMHVVPDDVDYLFLPVIAHRILLTPSFAAETRALGRAESERVIKERCFAFAPPPAPDWRTAAPDA